MLVEVQVGNILQSKMQTLVNPINCVGRMGAGLAEQFKYLYPLMFADYERRCAQQSIRLGQPYVFTNHRGPKILMFPTKGHYQEASIPLNIKRGLRYFREHCTEWEIKSIAFPALGCGCGGLSWATMRRFIREELEDIDIPVELYWPFAPKS